MSAHRPKTAALLAYAEGLLSAKGRARLERHLATCPACRRELAAIQLYDELSDDARESAPPDVDYARMELRLAREAERVSQELRIAKRPRPWGWVAVAAAAAACVATYAAWPEPEAPNAHEAPSAPAPVEPEVAPEAAPLSPIVTLAAGAAERVSGADATALAAGDVLAEGSVLRTGEGGTAHVRLSDGTGLVLAPSSRLELRRAREDAVELALQEGRVDSTVATLESGSTYVVLCAGYAIEVRGTRFAVSYVDGVVGVDLAEGAVRVRPPDGAPVELSAPARWRSTGDVSGEPEVSSPRALAAPAEELTQATITHPDLVRWEIDGTAFDALGPVRLSLAEGEHELRGWDLRGRLYTALVPVSGAAIAIEPSALVAEGPRLRPGHLPPEEITRVLRQANATDRVRGCYERTLRDNPQVYGRLRVRVSVGMMGDVRRVSVDGGEAADTARLRECITRVASGWTFPPPGGPVTFELPLAFSSRP